jgi:hypothetical protein
MKSTVRMFVEERRYMVEATVEICRGEEMENQVKCSMRVKLFGPCDFIGYQCGPFLDLTTKMNFNEVSSSCVRFVYVV